MTNPFPSPRLKPKPEPKPRLLSPSNNWEGHPRVVALDFFLMGNGRDKDELYRKEMTRLGEMAKNLWYALLFRTEYNNKVRVEGGMANQHELSGGLIAEGHIEDGNAVFLWRDADVMMELHQLSRVHAPVDSERPASWVSVPLTVERLQYFWLPKVAVFTVPAYSTDGIPNHEVVGPPLWVAAQMLMSGDPWKPKTPARALLEWERSGQ